MKTVIAKQELYEVMERAVKILCDAVGSTLGPSGNNCLINTDDATPYITNDGVTIAESIGSEDIKINTVLEIAKESALKTNEVVGDGTTTTLVLMQSIFNSGLKQIINGKNPIQLRLELNKITNDVVEKLKQLKRIPTKEDLISIATTSVEDEKLGKLIADLFIKMNSKYSIILEESNNEDTYVNLKKGYTIDINNISNIYFGTKEELVIKNANVLILKGYLQSFEQISDIINEVISNNKNLIILAEDVEESLYQEVLVYYLQEKKNIFLLQLPDYGSRKESIAQDIAMLTDAKIKNINYEEVYFTDLGNTKNVLINKDNLTLLNDKDVSKYVDNLKKLLVDNNDYEKEFIYNRIAKLEQGVATIYVGGVTKTEVKEKIMRIEDSLFALQMASEGVVIGEGLAFLQVSQMLNSSVDTEQIIKDALQVPFVKILENSAVNYEEIKKDIINSNFTKIYNLVTNELENVNCTKVLDPIKVVITALKNATSIATMLLTTKYIIINEKLKEKIDTQKYL